MTVGWAFFTWFNVVTFPITEGPRWTRGFTSNVILTCCYTSFFMIGQVLWRRDIKKGLYKRAIEEEENEEALNEKLGSENIDDKPSEQRIDIDIDDKRVEEKRVEGGKVEEVK